MSGPYRSYSLRYNISSSLVSRVRGGIMSGGSTQDLKERVARLEAILGVLLEGCSFSTLCEWIAAVQRDVAAVQKSLNEKSS
jgi:hypothetical protein